MDDCLFCKIARGETSTTFVYQSEHVVAFPDIKPRTPTHILVIPRKHISSYATAAEDDALLLGQVALAATVVAKQAGIDESGFRVVSNSGADAGQTVDHLHLHVLGGQAMGWPPFPTG